MGFREAGEFPWETSFSPIGSCISVNPNIIICTYACSYTTDNPQYVNIQHSNLMDTSLVLQENEKEMREKNQFVPFSTSLRVAGKKHSIALDRRQCVCVCINRYPHISSNAVIQIVIIINDGNHSIFHSPAVEFTLHTQFQTHFHYYYYYLPFYQSIITRWHKNVSIWTWSFTTFASCFPRPFSIFHFAEVKRKRKCEFSPQQKTHTHTLDKSKYAKFLVDSEREILSNISRSHNDDMLANAQSATFAKERKKKESDSVWNILHLSQNQPVKRSWQKKRFLSSTHIHAQGTGIHTQWTLFSVFLLFGLWWQSEACMHKAFQWSFWLIGSNARATIFAQQKIFSQTQTDTIPWVTVG